MKKTAVGILVSGSGTNLEALLQAAASAAYPARIAVVVSNIPGAFALERARKAGVATVVIEPKKLADKVAFEHALVEALRAHGVELVCLAGFMRLLGPTFLRAFPDAVLNIHPALLPSFPGLHAPRQALAHGVKLSGCTVHFVDEGTDTGPIVGQAAVPVLADDDEATLAARILLEEHRLYPLALRLVAEGRVRPSGNGPSPRSVVRLDALPAGEGLSLRNPGKS